MRFTKIRLEGAFVVDIEPIIDERGAFARTY
ncbi:MAG: dTDP-4-dehydrorhamnose 3,5-epimerase, partial [Gammaproteobacteria bacterium]|nr:dTDP-4-dehydrorhamnose 3,5-epimerase [Gammaproteobacteria bacterium]